MDHKAEMLRNKDSFDGCTGVVEVNNYGGILENEVLDIAKWENMELFSGIGLPIINFRR